MKYILYFQYVIEKQNCYENQSKFQISSFPESLPDSPGHELHLRRSFEAGMGIIQAVQKPNDR